MKWISISKRERERERHVHMVVYKWWTRGTQSLGKLEIKAIEEARTT